MPSLYEEPAYGDVESHGDNFPILQLRTLINKERTELVERLLIENLGPITKDDITDFIIDISLYNNACKKRKSKKC